MKKIILFSLLAFLTSNIYPQSFIYIPSGIQELTSISFFNERGVTAGAQINSTTMQGKFVYSVNGYGWELAASPQNLKRVYEVQLVSEQVGYAGGLRGDTAVILKTTDGGVSWNYFAGLHYCIFINGLYFINESVGFLTVKNIGSSSIMKTTNGGLSWSTQLSNSTSDYKDILFGDTNTGFVIESRGDSCILLKTTDSGQTWFRSFSAKARIADMSYSGNQTYYIITNDTVSNAFKSTNAGAAWVKMNIPQIMPQFEIFQMIDFYPGSNIGFIFWDNLDVPNYYKTGDYGNTWSGPFGLNWAYYSSSTMTSQNQWFLATSSISNAQLAVVDGNTPVEFGTFDAIANSNNVLLRWTTITEKNNNGFLVQRKYQSEDWKELHFVSGIGTSTEAHAYSYTDKVSVPGSYSYRLKQVDFDGKTELSKEVNVNYSIAENYSLDQNYPNPFNPTTTIKYSVPVQGKVSLHVTDILGNVVSVLVDEERAPGIYQIEFNAGSLASGIYFYTLNAGTYSSTKKLLLLK